MGIELVVLAPSVLCFFCWPVGMQAHCMFLIVLHGWKTCHRFYRDTLLNYIVSFCCAYSLVQCTGYDVQF